MPTGPDGNNSNDIHGLLLTAIVRSTPMIIDALQSRGLVVIADAIPSRAREALRDDLLQMALAPAGIGRAQGLQRDTSIRSDSIAWMDASSPAQGAWLAAMEALRTAINRELFLGLFDYECHYAHYRQGEFYRRHRDAFAGSTLAKSRVLSTVCYLNDSWHETDAGELLIYDGESNADEQPLQKIAPAPGSLVIFLSEQFPHEVLPTSVSRLSIAGWFRRS
jgi:SM-20-related protein